ncbi:hypothetical protein OROHE_018544 [Orobanche hederae]
MASATTSALNLVDNHLRALKKKHKRILEMEKKIDKGELLNEDQKKTLRSKPTIVACIDLLEKIQKDALEEESNKIMASECFITTPEIKAPVDVAAAARNYTSFQVSVHGAMVPSVSSTIPAEHSHTKCQHEKEERQPNILEEEKRVRKNP